MKIILVAFEGTLSDDNHRQDYLFAKDYEAYHNNISGDKPKDDVINVVDILGGEWELVVYSTSPTEYELEISDWLAENHVFPEHIITRPKNNFETGIDFKFNLIQNLYEPNDVVCIIDENQIVCEKLKGAGYTVMMVI